MNNPSSINPREKNANGSVMDSIILKMIKYMNGIIKMPRGCFIVSPNTIIKPF